MGCGPSEEDDSFTKSTKYEEKPKPSIFTAY